MRVNGACCLVFPYPFGFSPFAIFSPPTTTVPSGSVPVIRISSTVRPRYFTYSVCPPITFPEPGMMFAVVTPPLSAIRMPGSSGLIASSARRPGWTGPLPSPPSEFAATCRAAEQPDVRVRVHEARNHDRPAEVAALAGVGRQLQELVPRPDLCDLPVRDDEEPALDRLFGRGGVDRRVVVYDGLGGRST